MTKKIQNGGGRRLLAGASVSMLALGAGLLAPNMALAQDDATDLGEVVVTGTRIAGFDAPTPVTTLGGEDLKANAARNVADLVSDIPELRPTRNIGATLAPIGLAQINLRGLNGADAAQRTLVMIDGRRVSPTAYTGWVDANIIPASLISRVEVVTGGASAAYGSDAVAGVVNFILDRNFEGFKGDLSYGESKYKDNRQPAISLTYGKSFADDKAHFIISGDYYSDSGALSQSQRDWGREGWCANTNTVAGRPFVFFRPNCKFSQITWGGVTGTTAPAAIRNIQFGPNGTILPFNRGTEIGTQFMTGGDGIIFDTQTIAVKTKRKSGFAAFSYDFSDKLQFFADAIYSEVRIFADSRPENDSPNQTAAPLITQDNAYLPAQLRAIMVANNIANFRLGRAYREMDPTTSDLGTNHGRYTFGFKGDLNDDWNWEAYVAIARTKFDRISYAARDNAKFNLSVDAVINPATGQPACRVNVDANPNNNDPACVPSNLFGDGSISPQAVAYWQGATTQDVKQEEDVAALTLRGTPFTLPAGDVGLAVGVEARRDDLKQVGDLLSQTNGWKSANFPTYSGEVKVKEAFAEVALPLLADMSLIQKLDVNFAGRITDYSTSGTVKTWKAGFNYQPIESLRFRGTISRDIRAPSIYELFRPSANSSIVTVNDFVTGASQQAVQRTGGNPDLKPEVAKTHTIGAIFSPEFIPGLRMSVDYYKINIKDVIGGLSAQQTIDQCRDGNTEICALITRAPNNTIQLIAGNDINAQSLKTSGVDTEIQYKVPLDDVLPWGGDLTFRVLGAYTQYRITTVAGIKTDIAGQNNNGIPTWKVNTSATYNNGPLMFRTSVRFIGDGKFNKTLEEGTQIEDNSMKGYTYVDLAASYQVNENFQIYANVNNLFNVEPVLSPSAILEVGYSGGGNYDLIGQWWSLGVRFNF